MPDAKSDKITFLPELIKTPRGALVLLFYDGYELKAKPGFAGGMYSQARRMLRHTKRTLCRQQVQTGFYTAFRSLCKGLQKIGCDVRVNNFAAAAAHPDYPIGVAGYPTVNNLGLANPRIFGPGDFGTPEEASTLAADPRFKRFIQPSDWFAELYRPYCGDKIVTWFAGIDTKKLADLSKEKKDFDFLIYDKISFNREKQLPEVLGRVVRHLEAAGHSFTTLRYGEHHHSHFLRALKHSQALLYLSQHETQGLACQEAMASNLPILAWDEGKFLDPRLVKFITEKSHVSSVPYFSPECGMRFKINDFEKTCDGFWRQRGNFTPRHYVENTLSLTLSAAKYLAEYARLIPPR